MTESNAAVQILIAQYWSDQGLYLSMELLDHQEFLMTFHPRGDRDRDLNAILIGVGRQEMLDICRRLQIPLDQLGEMMRRNHSEELARLARGERPRFEAIRRAAPEQIQLYEHMLTLEEQILRAVLRTGGRERAA